MAPVHCLRARPGCREPHFRSDVLSLSADDVEANVCDDPVRKRVYSLGKDFIPQERTLFPSYRFTGWLAFGSSYLRDCMTCACGKILSDTCDTGTLRGSPFDPHVGPTAKVTTGLSPQTLLVSARQIALRQQACPRSLEASQLSDSRPTDPRAGLNPTPTLPDVSLLEA